MKHARSSEFTKKLTNFPFTRSLRIFLGVGVVGTITIVVFVIWAGIAPFRGVANLTQDAKVVDKVLSLQTEINNLAVIPEVGCWNAAQRLLNVEVWLEKPIADNVNSLKLACLNTREK